MVSVHLASKAWPVQCLPTAAISRAAFTAEVKNVKGERDVRKHTRIPYISHRVVINAPSQGPQITLVRARFVLWTVMSIVQSTLVPRALLI